MRDFSSYVKRESLVHKLNPVTKLLSFIVLLASSIIASSPIAIAVVITITLSLVIISKVPFKVLFKPILNLWLFFIIIFLMNALLQNMGDAYFKFYFISLSKESLFYSFAIIFHVAFAVFLSSLYSATSTPKEITDAISTLLSPLSIFHFPSEEVATILSISLQLIPILSDETKTIIRSQSARGAGIEGKGIKNKVEGITPIIIPLFIAAFRRSDEIATAMEARGYGCVKRVKRRKLNFSFYDLISFVTMLLLLTAEILLRRFS